MHPTGNPQLAEWLVAEWMLTPEQGERALSQQELLGARIEEAILETGAIGEPELLEFLASTYETRFVTCEKLATKAQIDPATLARVPKQLAERYTAFPMTFGAQSST
jgi:hypothetical protein